MDSEKISQKEQIVMISTSPLGSSPASSLTSSPYSNFSSDCTDLNAKSKVFKY